MANCIFFGVTFANSVQAIGIPGRCAIWAGKPGKADGHFTAEWWSKEHQKWVMVDPNFDAMFLRAADNLGRGVETHGLAVEKRGAEDVRVMAFQPGRDIDQKRE